VLFRLTTDRRLLTASFPKRRHDLLSEQPYPFAVVQSGAAQIDNEMSDPDIDVGLKLLADRRWIADQDGFARLLYAYTSDLSHPLQQCLRARRVGIDEDRREV